MCHIPQQIRRSKVIQITQRMKQFADADFAMLRAESIRRQAIAPLLPSRFLWKFALVQHFLDQHLRVLSHRRVKLRTIDQSALELSDQFRR
jgi:hypothetical protein